MERGSGALGRLLGRQQECAALDELVANVQSGRSASLVLHGEAGIGKTALLGYARERAVGCRVVRVAGVEAEAELAFGGLHQLCAPFLDRIDRLPEPQRVALETALGLSAGNPPDRFLVGLAVLGLLADVADSAPLVCLIDDVQWLDHVSAQTLSFVVRRLLAERVLLLFALRDPVADNPVHGLPQREVRGLQDRDARALVASVTPRSFEPRVRDRILAEARGNPLALLELPRALTEAELAGQLENRGQQSVAGQLEHGFQARVRSLTADTQRLLLVAAAEPVGDLAILRRAAGELGIDVAAAAAEAEAADLLTIGNLVRFRHPLVRSAAYRAASPQERHAAHRALARVTDPDREPERLAWHRASATSAPDEDVAAALEQAAARARARGGVGAAAAFLDRAAQLTPDPAHRGKRAMAAAEAKSQAGAFGEALELLDDARLHPLDEQDTVQLDLIRGQVLSASQSPSAGLPLLLAAAKGLEKVDPTRARETYRDALYAAFTAGRLPGGEGVEAAAAAILAMSPAAQPSRSDLLLEGVARLYVDGYAAGVPLLQQALADYTTGGIAAADLGWLPLACRMAHNIWDAEAWAVLPAALAALARDLGALALLPSALLLQLSSRAQAGDLVAARALVAEAETVGEVTGSNFFAHYCALVLAGWRGDEVGTTTAIETVVNDPSLRDEGKALTATEWAAAVLHNGLGRYDDAYVAARRGAAHPQEMGLATSSMIELVEAAARTGRGHEADAVAAAERILEMTSACGTDWALGTAAYVRALRSTDRAAEELYRGAIDRLERAGLRIMSARAHLVYGEWLRAQDRRTDARSQLGIAHDQLSRIGVVSFAERARRELAAIGVATERPAAQTSAALTSQESRIARLAADGLTNPEIGAQLFISAHTVEWHLRKVFAKLGVRSRNDIGAALQSA